MVDDNFVALESLPRASHVTESYFFGAASEHLEKAGPSPNLLADLQIFSGRSPNSLADLQILSMFQLPGAPKAGLSIQKNRGNYFDNELG